MGGKRRVLGCLALAAVLVTTLSCNSGAPAITESLPPGGGKLVITYRSEPESFNRLITATSPVELIRLITHDTLVRINRKSGVLEPRLATSWKASDDGLIWTLVLRDDVLFSDGTVERNVAAERIRPRDDSRYF